MKVRTLQAGLKPLSDFERFVSGGLESSADVIGVSDGRSYIVLPAKDAYEDEYEVTAPDTADAITEELKLALKGRLVLDDTTEAVKYGWVVL